MNVTTLTYAELEHADQVRAPLACYETKSPRLIGLILGKLSGMRCEQAIVLLHIMGHSDNK